MFAAARSSVRAALCPADDHSLLMFQITLPHVCASSPIRFANSAGESCMGAPPISLSRLQHGACQAGVFRLGHVDERVTYPLVRRCQRRLPLEPRGRFPQGRYARQHINLRRRTDPRAARRPVLMVSMEDGGLWNRTCTWPPNSLVSAAASLD